MKTSTSHARRTPNWTPVAWERPIEHFKFDAYSAKPMHSGPKMESKKWYQNGSKKKNTISKGLNRQSHKLDDAVGELGPNPKLAPLRFLGLLRFMVPGDPTVHRS